ncbi:MAG: phosphodiester glycosidase family protein, partial [Clostridia bacterium]|nr:phosphodiester glycosidase family protein [Clostridia bacterium]
VVADGRRKNHSDGMTLPELQQIFLDVGAQIAFNLDGGGSSTLYFNGEVLNKPAGGVERSVSDILFFD